DASGLVRERQALGVIAHVDRRLAEPKPRGVAERSSQPGNASQRIGKPVAPVPLADDLAEQLLRPNGVLLADAEEVVVDHKEKRLGRFDPLSDAVGHPPPPDRRAVEMCHAAILAANRAAARRLNRGYVVFAVDRLQVLPRAAEAGRLEVRKAAVIEPLQPSR